jgi:predicted amidohydrolase
VNSSFGRPLVIGALLLVSSPAPAAESAAADHLQVAVVQMALSNTVADNRDRIVARVSRAAALGARVVVFPEGALRGAGDDDGALVDKSVVAIRHAARDSNVYVLFGGKTYSPQMRKAVNWMRVIGPDGRELLYYEKLYDNHHAAMPGVFHIDGVPCHAMICADRWLRGVEEVPIHQGAQVGFELSNNFGCEWVPPFEWYWNVSRALRNSVWVVFANSCNADGVESVPPQSCHGHSAIIAPDGQVAASTRDNAETIVVVDLDLSRATRAAAQARATHPALRPFWEAGVKLQRGEEVDAPPLKQRPSTETDITLAAAQVSGELSVMLSMVRQARERHADLVVFPALAIDETSLETLQDAARQSRITLVVGMEHREGDARFNSAFVIGPDGALLTRYDQLSATSPYRPGTDARAMWFHVKGAPAVVTIGTDSLWTELAELAAVAGARIHVHLDHDPAADPEAALRRLQIGANAHSFHTFGASVNFTGSALWDDLCDRDERRAALWKEGFYGKARPADVPNSPPPEAGAVEVLSPFSANLIARAGDGSQLLVATRHITPRNEHYPRRTSNFNPQMDAWYRIGAALIAQPTAAASEDELAWRRLPLVADGKIAPGWVHLWGGGLEVVDDGILRTACTDEGMGLLMYKKERFGDCQIRVVYRCQHERSNSGVYVRIDEDVLERRDDPLPRRERDADGKLTRDSIDRIRESSEAEREAWYAVHHGYEVQIYDAGDASHRTGAIYSLAPADAVAAKAGEWRTMVITLEGERVLVEIDGQRVTSFDPHSPEVPDRKNWTEPKRDAARPRSGYFGLQNHDPGDVVDFREVSVRPLPARAGGKNN